MLKVYFYLVTKFAFQSLYYDLWLLDKEAIA